MVGEASVWVRRERVGFEGARMKRVDGRCRFLISRRDKRHNPEVNYPGLRPP